ncbi:uncharacterized protein LOC124699310 [Lolium rigidum]|uniref:uncharacterized protein LOC124699310 n=1 Tax=Lolium rigidum TaxID=89674 RepID=UPI001F5CACF1|nr:uncharacterized protein LOC124699310 [Lolium rigidum]
MDHQGQSSGSDSVVLEMDSLLNELKRKLKSLKSSKAQPQEDSFPRIMVAKVGHLRRNVCNSEYDPDHVSIGPYNHPRQLPTQQDKVRSLLTVLSAAEEEEPSMTVEVYLKELACLEDKARRYYANTFDDITSDQFVHMLLLDGCYILSRFASFPAKHTAHAAGATRSSAFAAELEDLAVVRDVFFLAENQIPFFVLEKIGELTVPGGSAHVGKWIADHALELMKAQRYAVAAPAMVPPELTAPENLLHLLHMHLKPQETDALLPTATGKGAADDKPVSSVGRWRTATEYSYAGVNFKSQEMSEKGGVRCILDVKLDSGGGTLEVPRLDIDNETWRLLRNLMELEQRNREAVGSYVTAYCVFMSQLASDKKDVELLSKRGVIVHAHGNDGEVAQHFADLCKGIMFDTSEPKINYLWDIRQKLEKRSRSYPRRWMAWLKRKYFSNPWLAVGLLAAAVGLVCAIVQAVYSVLSYKQGWN